MRNRAWRNLTRQRGSMKTLADLRAQLDEYERTYRRDGLAPLESSPLYDLYPDRGRLPDQLIEGYWPMKWPSSDAPGVYIILDVSLFVLYVGKASMGSCIGKRLGSYFVSDGGGCRIVHHHEGAWSEEP